MRSIACLAAAAALVLTPAFVSAQTAASHQLNTKEDFSYNPPSASGCKSWSEYDSKMNIMFVASCTSEEKFNAAFSVGDKMDKNCSADAQTKDFVCKIRSK